MSFDKLTTNYLKEFQKVCKVELLHSQKAIELATRPQVHRYIELLAEFLKAPDTQIFVHHDVNYTRLERPDWRLEDPHTFGVYCFGDHKSLSLGKAFKLSSKERSQIQRYLELGRPVFIFDGLEFLFFKDSIDSPVREALIDKGVSLEDDWSSFPINPNIEIRFRELLNNPGFRKWTESQLIEQLAIRARALSNEIYSLLEAPFGSGMNASEDSLMASLHCLKKTIEKHHDPSLNDASSCADFISQVLTFGLFYAHTRSAFSASNPQEKRSTIRQFWNDEGGTGIASELRPFKAIIDEVSDVIGEINILADWYNEILGVLSHAEFMGTEHSELDFHILFESFLAKFDSKVKFDRGAFYTPQSLARWVANFTNNLSNKYFSADIFDIADKVIEPCCGTGSFLEALCRLTKNKIPRKLIGYEILPAPYALSQYRLARVREELEVEVDLNIYLTDTLSDMFDEKETNELNGFSIEHNEATESSMPPVRIVIGNPPSSNHPANSAPRTKINSMLSDFRPPKSEIGDRQNIQKALNNEAYRFLRWSANKVLENDSGIMALVLPGAFNRAISFKYARQWLAEKFSSIYVLEIDGDARTNDTSKSIFSVLQGRTALFCINNRTDKGTLAIFHKDISFHTMDNKLAFLSKDIDFKDFNRIDFSFDNCLFAPSTNYPKELWIKCWPLLKTTEHQGIFSEKCSAVKLAPSSMLFHSKKQILIRRSQELGNHRGIDTVMSKWFKGQKRPPNKNKLTNEVKNELISSVKDPTKNISRYHFRPFVEGWVLNSDELFNVLSSAPGGGTRARPEIRKAFADKAIGISIAPSPVDLGSTLTRFACFSWALPDNDIAARGNAMVYCDRFAFKGRTKDSLEINLNISQTILGHFSFSESPSTTFLYYAYAILCSQSFLDTFEGVLYRPSDPTSPIRLPISSDNALIMSICQIGEKIALCENFDVEIQLFDDSLPLSFTKNEFSCFKLKKYTYIEDDETVILHGINGEVVTLVGIPPIVIALKISGHNVLDKWLRERTFPYLRREFDFEDYCSLIDLVNRIDYQQDLIAEVDILVQQVITTEELIEPLPV